MTRFTFIVPGPPQPKERARQGKGGRWYTPEKTRRYERSIREAACVYIPNDWRTDGLFELQVTCVFDDYRHRDADNVLKACSDALNKIAFDDDSQVWKTTTVKMVEPGQARTVVTVTRIGDAPVRARKGKRAA